MLFSSQRSMPTTSYTSNRQHFFSLIISVNPLLLLGCYCKRVSITNQVLPVNKISDLFEVLVKINLTYSYPEKFFPPERSRNDLPQ